MRVGIRLQSPALVVSVIALFVALGGSVYAATGINGKTIKVKSLPGNRVKLHSLPPNRLKPNTLAALGLRLPLTGTTINELTLGQVPSAAHAETADSAQSAVDAQTALNAVNAVNAETVNGHTAGCLPGTQPFAGACWQSSPSATQATAPDAAANCATVGGALPEALQLAAFAEQPGVNLDAAGEWSSNLSTFSGPNSYAVVTVFTNATLDTALSTANRKYRCVMPLVK